MVWAVSRFRLKTPPVISSSCISPLTSSGQRSRASWASQPQTSATLLPQPGGKPRKFIRTCGVIGKKKIYIYIPPDDGLQICPKHVEVDWRNKLRINSASSWFSLHRCIEMHGQQNIKFVFDVTLWCYRGRFHTVRQSKATCWLQCYTYYSNTQLLSATGAISRQHHKKYWEKINVLICKQEPIGGMKFHSFT